MTYYNQNGDYCDIANCYVASGIFPNINDACDAYGCWNNTADSSTANTGTPYDTTANTGSYKDPYCAPNGYCNYTMTYYNQNGDFCDIANCYVASGVVPNINDACDAYGCWNNTADSSTANTGTPYDTTANTGSYKDPYCAPNGYCNNTMTYYNQNGDYCDIANCYTSAGVVPNHNDACDAYGCWNETDTTTGSATTSSSSANYSTRRGTNASNKKVIKQEQHERVLNAMAKLAQLVK